MLLPNYMYAPRTIERYGKRYLIPWVADRLNGSDDNRSEFGAEGVTWGGALGTPQEMRCLPDGRLALFYPDIVAGLSGAQTVGAGSLHHLQTERGEWKRQGETVLASCEEGMARGLVAVRGQDFLLSCRIKVSRGVAAGLILRAGEGERGRLLPAPGTGTEERLPVEVSAARGSFPGHWRSGWCPIWNTGKRER